ncbi:MAG: hypothetical protein ABI442_02925 [Gemmatimonadaceae bacterium]
MITHPEKVMFPDDGITKGELAAYYATVAPVMLPHLRMRPVTMERFHRGIGEKGFFQKNVERGAPAWLERVAVPKKDGVVNYPLITDARGLEWLANQNCIIAVPVDRSDEWSNVARFAHGVGRMLVTRHPDRFTQEFYKADRGDRILIDTGRNESTATFASPYAVRPKPGARVSAPCTWDEVAQGTAVPKTFTLHAMAARVQDVGDVWAALYDLPCALPVFAT